MSKHDLYIIQLVIDFEDLRKCVLWLGQNPCQPLIHFRRCTTLVMCCTQYLYTVKKMLLLVLSLNV